MTVPDKNEAEVIEDFRMMDLPDRGRLLTHLLSLATSLKVLKAAKEKKCKLEQLPDPLKRAVITGINDGLKVIAEIKIALEDFNAGKEFSSYRMIHLQNTLKNCSFFRGGMLYDIVSGRKLAETDKIILEHAITKLGELRISLLKLEGGREVPDDLMLDKLSRDVNDLQQGIFKDWTAAVSAIEQTDEEEDEFGISFAS